MCCICICRITNHNPIQGIKRVGLGGAFDTIDHSLLIKKLENFGIRGVVLNWVKSYLTDRKQYLSLGYTTSDLLSVVCGVP